MLEGGGLAPSSKDVLAYGLASWYLYWKMVTLVPLLASQQKQIGLDWVGKLKRGFEAQK